MKCLLIFLVLVLTPGALPAADFNAGIAAYENQDYAKAFAEFSALAQAGDPHAQYMLGRLYAQGKGVVQDKVQAHKWYDLAVVRGHSHAAAARDALARDMPSAQIARARRLAGKWQPDGTVASAATGASSLREVGAGIQTKLNELGYDAGMADGVMGDKTRAAIRDYQGDHGLAIDGQPSEALLQHIQATQRTAGSDTDLAGNLPWPRLLLTDTFKDGDYTRSPAWTVTAGEFSADPTVGLRTLYEPRRPAAETKVEDLPIAILDAILGQTTRGSEAAATSDYAEIYVPAPITNAFSLQLKLSLRQAATGPLAFGPYQGADQTGGYRLLYTPSDARALHLVRMTKSGSSVIESADTQFSVNRQYTVQWTRDRSGEMVVSVDGKEMFRVTDRGYTDPFDGFTLINRGGDYALKEITIYGVN